MTTANGKESAEAHAGYSLLLAGFCPLRIAEIGQERTLSTRVRIRFSTTNRLVSFHDRRNEFRRGYVMTFSHLPDSVFFGVKRRCEILHLMSRVRLHTS